MMFASALGRLPTFRKVWSEADELEAEYGREDALRIVRERISKAARTRRRRLYLLHDEIARRAIVKSAF